MTRLVDSHKQIGKYAPAVFGALALTLAVMLNDLGFNLWFMYQRLGDSKVMRGISSEINLALRDLAPQVILMVLLTAGLTFAAALAWMAVSRVACRAFMERRPSSRLARPAFWFFNIAAFFNILYGVHDLLFPQADLVQSPLALAFGLVDPLNPALSSGLWLLALSLPLAGATLWMAARSSRAVRVALACGAAGIAAVFGGYAFATRPGTPAQFTQKGNIILLGMDSMQYNRLPVGGSPVNYAPNVNAFFEESYQFANAWTPFARTYPSWLSILTGRDPVRHGIRFNLMGDEFLDPGNRYLADVLRERGYHTFHAMDGTRFCNIRPVHGYDHLLVPRMGIEDFLIGDFFDFSVANLIRQTALGNDLFPAIRNNNAASAYNPRLFTRALLREMNRLPKGQPLFISMHLSADHWPFKTPAPWSHGSANPVENCIRMVDDQMGQVVDFLRESGLWERSTVIMLSDHGDGWSGEPGDVLTTHGEHFNKLWANRIILAMHRPGGQPGISRELVRTMDLYPTVLELAGCEAPEGIDGRSLLPAMRGEATAPRPLFAETGLERNAATAGELARKNAGLYTYDPATRLVSIKKESQGPLLDAKYYMLIEDGWLLWTRPLSRKFVIRPFDGTMYSAADPADCPQAVRRRMLARLAEHFGLAPTDLLAMARQTGFLREDGPVMAAGRPAGPSPQAIDPGELLSFSVLTVHARFP